MLEGEGFSQPAKKYYFQEQATFSQILDPAMLHFKIFHDLYTFMRTDGIRELP